MRSWAVSTLHQLLSYSQWPPSRNAGLAGWGGFQLATAVSNYFLIKGTSLIGKRLTQAAHISREPLSSASWREGDPCGGSPSGLCGSLSRPPSSEHLGHLLPPSSFGTQTCCPTRPKLHSASPGLLFAFLGGPQYLRQDQAPACGRAPRCAKDFLLEGPLWRGWKSTGLGRVQRP